MRPFLDSTALTCYCAIDNLPTAHHPPCTRPPTLYTQSTFHCSNIPPPIRRQCRRAPFTPRPLQWSCQPILASVITHFCIPSTREADSGGSQVQSQCGLCIEFQTTQQQQYLNKTKLPPYNFTLSLLFLPKMPQSTVWPGFPSCTCPPGKHWCFTTCLLADGMSLSPIQVSLRANTAHLLRSGTFTVTRSLMSISVSCDLML